jgi:hypothetical protein
MMTAENDLKGHLYKRGILPDDKCEKLIRWLWLIAKASGEGWEEWDWERAMREGWLCKSDYRLFEELKDFNPSEGMWIHRSSKKLGEINMEVELKDFKIDGTETTLRSHADVLYKGEKIGQAHQTPGYPMGVRTSDGEEIGSFTSRLEAFKALLVASGVLGKAHKLDDNIFPDEDYILRVSNITVVADPNPEVTPIVTAKIHFNTKDSYGNSSASKPARAKMVTIDLIEGKFLHNNKELTFSNQEGVFNKIKNAITEWWGD